MSGVAGTLGAILFVVSVIGVVAAPVLVFMFAPGFRGTEGEVRAGGVDAAVHLSVHFLCVADGAVWRGAEQLRAVRDSGVHVDADERRDDCALRRGLRRGAPIRGS